MLTVCTRPPGAGRVIDLHGRLDLVSCMACSNMIPPRADFQDELVRLKPGMGSAGTPATLPDGDADLDGLDFASVCRTALRMLRRCP